MFALLKAIRAALRRLGSRAKLVWQALYAPLPSPAADTSIFKDDQPALGGDACVVSGQDFAPSAVRTERSASVLAEAEPASCPAAGGRAPSVLSEQDFAPSVVLTQGSASVLPEGTLVLPFL